MSNSGDPVNPTFAELEAELQHYLSSEYEDLDATQEFNPDDWLLSEEENGMNNAEEEIGLNNAEEENGLNNAEDPVEEEIEAEPEKSKEVLLADYVDSGDSIDNLMPNPFMGHPHTSTDSSVMDTDDTYAMQQDQIDDVHGAIKQEPVDDVDGAGVVFDEDQGRHFYLHETGDGVVSVKQEPYEDVDSDNFNGSIEDPGMNFYLVQGVDDGRIVHEGGELYQIFEDGHQDAGQDVFPTDGEKIKSSGKKRKNKEVDYKPGERRPGCTRGPLPGTSGIGRPPGKRPRGESREASKKKPSSNILAQTIAAIDPVEDTFSDVPESIAATPPPTSISISSPVDFNSAVPPPGYRGPSGAMRFPGPGRVGGVAYDVGDGEVEFLGSGRVGGDGNVGGRGSSNFGVGGRGSYNIGIGARGSNNFGFGGRGSYNNYAGGRGSYNYAGGRGSYNNYSGGRGSYNNYGGGYGSIGRGSGQGGMFGGNGRMSDVGRSIRPSGLFRQDQVEPGRYIRSGPRLVSILVECDKFYTEKKADVHDLLDTRLPIDCVVEKNDDSGLVYAAVTVTEADALYEIQVLNGLVFDGERLRAKLFTNEEPHSFPQIVAMSK